MSIFVQEMIHCAVHTDPFYICRDHVTRLSSRLLIEQDVVTHYSYSSVCLLLNIISMQIFQFPVDSLALRALYTSSDLSRGELLIISFCRF